MLLKPTKQTTIPFSHMKQLMSDDGYVGSNIRIRRGGLGCGWERENV